MARLGSVPLGPSARLGPDQLGPFLGSVLPARVLPARVLPAPVLPAPVLFGPVRLDSGPDGLLGAVLGSGLFGSVSDDLVLFGSGPDGLVPLGPGLDGSASAIDPANAGRGRGGVVWAVRADARSVCASVRVVRVGWEGL
ncbi:hypothetical protein [Dactylosporangium sp. CA-092794]|uniref:hypothetical protein n=1 Tax=Dactylosporangium sp. CA-092794 TaxID=3239929 RepID=UPI003D8DD23E